MKNKFFSIFLLFVLAIFIFTSCGIGAVNNSTDAADMNKLGLYVENGKIMRHGKEYYAVGANYFAAFYQLTVDPLSSDYIKGFKILDEYSVPYVRINMGGFGADNFELYFSNPDMYLTLMDEVVNEADKYGIGIICSIFWYFPVFADYSGEPCNAIGDVNSKTWTLMRQYITDIVTRYKDHPAVWGWEYGNEYSLMVDVPNGIEFIPDNWVKSERQERDENDVYITEDITTAFDEFARVVREIDPVRMITTGNSQPRPCQWHMHHTPENPWEADTVEQAKEMLKLQHGTGCDVVSIHVYGEEPERAYGMETFEVNLKTFKDAAEEIGCPMFLGEFGYPDNFAGMEDNARETFIKQLKYIEEYQIPLSAVWNFAVRGGIEFEVNPYRAPERAYMLEMIRDLNVRLAELS